jgi:hypothetical protein
MSKHTQIHKKGPSLSKLVTSPSPFWITHAYTHACMCTHTHIHTHSHSHTGCSCPSARFHSHCWPPLAAVHRPFGTPSFRQQHHTHRRPAPPPGPICYQQTWQANKKVGLNAGLPTLACFLTFIGRTTKENTSLPARYRGLPQPHCCFSVLSIF